MGGGSWGEGAGCAACGQKDPSSLAGGQRVTAPLRSAVVVGTRDRAVAANALSCAGAIPLRGECNSAALARGSGAPQLPEMKEPRVPRWDALVSAAEQAGPVPALRVSGF